jgi:hypothetical protein
MRKSRGRDNAREKDLLLYICVMCCLSVMVDECIYFYDLRVCLVQSWCKADPALTAAASHDPLPRLQLDN